MGTFAGRLWSKDALAALWTFEGGDPNESGLAAEIAYSESGGHEQAVSDTGCEGLWQICPPPPDAFDPHANARYAIAKREAAGDWSDWTQFNETAAALVAEWERNPDAFNNPTHHQGPLGTPDDSAGYIYYPVQGPFDLGDVTGPGDSYQDSSKDPLTEWGPFDYNARLDVSDIAPAGGWRNPAARELGFVVSVLVKATFNGVIADYIPANEAIVFDWNIAPDPSPVGDDYPVADGAAFSTRVVVGGTDRPEDEESPFSSSFAWHYHQGGIWGLEPYRELNLWPTDGGPQPLDLFELIRPNKVEFYSKLAYDTDDALFRSFFPEPWKPSYALQPDRLTLVFYPNVHFSIGGDVSMANHGGVDCVVLDKRVWIYPREPAPSGAGSIQGNPAPPGSLKHPRPVAGHGTWDHVADALS